MTGPARAVPSAAPPAGDAPARARDAREAPPPPARAISAQDDPFRLFRRLPLCRAFAEHAAASLLNDLPIVPPALDLRCGDGQIGLTLSRGRFPFAAGSESDRRAARAALATGLYARVTVGPPDRLPYPDGHFRTILCTGPLGSDAPPDAVFREVRRLLAPGGLFALALPAGGSVGARARLRSAALRSAGLPAARCAGCATPEELVGTLAAAGLRVARRAGTGGALSGWLVALASLHLAKARVYARLLARPLPFPGLHRRMIAPVGVALCRLAALLDRAGEEHLLLLARRDA